ncbi:hypothetical protein [Actinomadura sp. WMMB 499]|uniref:hypothetical protein n=1 Tax=Actinomadura sp. WMMB 499 TaxID=1219491 RepID=UPI0012449ABB|nr:hypothetical protein [Actinomadura sp. WMMB 499]QFG21945.1 hypothetical protein F7P10_13255 [Actinomadura sp. WMMB 499]
MASADDDSGVIASFRGGSKAGLLHVTDSEAHEYFDAEECATGFVVGRTFVIVGMAVFVDDVVEVRVRSDASSIPSPPVFAGVLEVASGALVVGDLSQEEELGVVVPVDPGGVHVTVVRNHDQWATEVDVVLTAPRVDDQSASHHSSRG